ncbi:MAG: aspartate/glutamate racemase family protein [Rhodobacteraceae bacterium]|nr:aspartate/glutamate racemase family protein [Paracoccaceae bacterium]
MTVETTTMIEHLPFTTAQVIASRARIGIVVLATDYTLEHEFRHLVTLPGVDFYHARIANSTEITPETLRAMQPLLTATASLILPGDTLDVLAFACTSASIVLGTETVAANLKAAKPEAATTNPAFAAFNAFRALGAKRIAILTPYARSVNEFVQRSVEEAGFEVPVFGSFNEPHDPTVAAIDTKSLKSAIARITAGHDVDAVFISCTSVRIAASVAEIEAELGVPVTSSNHALAWHCLRLAGVDDKLPQHGRLYAL